MLVEKISPLPPGNPFNGDFYHMGHHLGTNVTAMYRNFPGEHCPYVILVDTRTGERLRIRFDEELPNDAMPVE